jgi:hypothetical protein
MRTQQEIKAEVEALKALKPIGRLQFKTAASIALQIEELEFGYDNTAAEWWELTDEQRSCVMDARDWKEGDSNYRPSKEWDGLVA